MEFLMIESHFGVPQNLIRSHTRNQCSQDLVGIVNELFAILYPDEDLDIFLLPSADGCYKDTLKIIGKTLVTVSTVGLFVLAYLTYQNSSADYEHDKEMYIVDDTAKCLSIKQQLDDWEYEIDVITEEKLKKVCGNVKLKKLKNSRYQTLMNDEMVSSDETIVKNESVDIVLGKKVEREDFNMCIELLPENEDYHKENIEGVVELISLVVRQKKEGSGIPWRGVYYGDDIQEKGIDILLNGEGITFYMQDPDFKGKISNHEIVFSSDDNMRVVFDIKGVLDIDKIQNRKIYVTEVRKFNADLIEHKVKPNRNESLPLEGQMTLDI